MLRKDFRKLTEESSKRRLDLMFGTKNIEYAVESDALANFKQRASLIKCEPWEIAFCDASKHLIQIQDHLASRNYTKSESLASRFDDLHNYLDLLYAIHMEACGGPTKAR